MSGLKTTTLTAASCPDHHSSDVFHSWENWGVAESRLSCGTTGNSCLSETICVLPVAVCKGLKHLERVHVDPR